MIANSEHIFRGFSSYGNTDRQRPRIKIRRVEIGHKGITPLVDHHRPVALDISQAIPGKVRDRRRIIDGRNRDGGAAGSRQRAAAPLASAIAVTERPVDLHRRGRPIA